MGKGRGTGRNWSNSTHARARALSGYLDRLQRRSDSADHMSVKRQAAVVAAAQQKSRLRQNVESIAWALVIALCVRSSVVQAFWVPSGSMLPTIQIGDHIFVNKLAYSLRVPLIETEIFHLGEPDRNEIVVFISPVDPDTDLIKRIIAIGGDTVEIRNKKVLVNGAPIDDAHAFFDDPEISKQGQRDNYGPVKVPEGKFFVLGDNRDHSYDSRFWGFADVATVKGKATFIYWSWDSKQQKWLRKLRYDRLGHFLS
jgi:signal peptidase I